MTSSTYPFSPASCPPSWGTRTCRNLCGGVRASFNHNLSADPLHDLSTLCTLSLSLGLTLTMALVLTHITCGAPQQACWRFPLVMLVSCLMPLPQKVSTCTSTGTVSTGSA